MFERQTRQPFPTANILILGLVVIAFLVYVLKNINGNAPAPTPPATPPPADSGRIEVQIDSLAR